MRNPTGWLSGRGRCGRGGIAPGRGGVGGGEGEADAFFLVFVVYPFVEAVLRVGDVVEEAAG